MFTRYIADYWTRNIAGLGLELRRREPSRMPMLAHYHSDAIARRREVRTITLEAHGALSSEIFG
jgi:hypothetical protein